MLHIQQHIEERLFMAANINRLIIKIQKINFFDDGNLKHCKRY